MRDIISWRDIVADAGGDHAAAQSVFDVRYQHPEPLKRKSGSVVTGKLGKSAYVAVLRANTNDMPRFVGNVHAVVGQKEGAATALWGGFDLAASADYATITRFMQDYANHGRSIAELLPRELLHRSTPHEVYMHVGDGWGYIAQTRAHTYQNKRGMNATRIDFSAKRSIVVPHSTLFGLEAITEDELSRRLVSDFAILIAQQALVFSRNLSNRLRLPVNVRHEGIRGDLKFHYLDSKKIENKNGFDNIEGAKLDDYFSGYQRLKDELTEAIIEPIVYAEELKEHGIKAPQTLLLAGDPGVGKTTIAHAIAKVLDAEMREVKVADINTKYVGESEKWIAQLCEDIAARSGLQILFIDELDGAIKSGNPGSDTSFTKALSLSLDQLKEEKEDVLIIFVTNDEEDIPEFLKRPGRIDKRIYVEKPNERDLAVIFCDILSKHTNSQGLVDYPYEEFARLAYAKGMTGAGVRQILEDLARKKVLQKVKSQALEVEKIAASDVVKAVEEFGH